MSIIFNESEKISKEAQASLRRTMEKYVTKCRLILICENLGNLIPALLSRCLLIRCRGPTDQEMLNCLQKISTKENFAYEDTLFRKIVADSSYNLRRAILGVQNHYMRKNTTGTAKMMDWRDSVKSIVSEVKKSQTAQTLKNVRCYDLLVNCVPPGMILKELIVQFLPIFESELFKIQLVEAGAHYENILHLGSKALPFIEAFLAKVMVLITEESQEKGRKTK